MKTIKQTQERMGTVMEIVLVFEDSSSMEHSESIANQAIAEAFDEVERIENAYSRFSDDNELSALNEKVGEWVDVSSELYDLIFLGCEMKDRTEGAFDSTVKSVLEGWGYDANYSLKEHAPGNLGSIELKDGRVKLTAQIDLGGLGKGYAVDCMLKKLIGFPNLFVNAGGDLWCHGSNEKGEPWKAIFEHPTDPTQGIGWVEVNGFALASSSPSRRAWRNRHHLVDPRTGEPAQKMLAVYTQADSVLKADAYATALFVLGYEEAQSLVNDFPVETMLISPQGAIWRSEGFQGELFDA